MFLPSFKHIIEIRYNAKIEKILEDGSFSVLFLDYGNSDIVRAGEIVSMVEDVPAGDILDECVKVQVQAPVFDVGQVVVAKWSEDSVW